MVGGGSLPQPVEIQTLRFEESVKLDYNAQMNVKQISKYCDLNDASKKLLKTAMDSLNLSVAVYDMVLNGCETIEEQ